MGCDREVTTIFVSNTFFRDWIWTDVKFLYGVNSETRKLIEEIISRG